MGPGGRPRSKSFATKQQPGQPLGDLTAKAVLDKFAPLIWSRLKHFRVAGDEDAQAAAQLGLLNALASYDPAIDVSVGLYAKAHRLIDDEIKKAIRGKKSDAQSQPFNVSGDERLQYEDQETGDRWQTISKPALSDETVAAIEGAYDDRGRLQASRIPFATAMWLVETSERQSFGPRDERWTKLPATPQQMATRLAKIPPDKIASAIARLDARAQKVVIARFYRRPPILLDAIARELRLSYYKTVTVAQRATANIFDFCKSHRLQNHIY